MAGRSSVAAAGAVTVEGAPRLSAPPAVFTVTWRAPERETETDNGRVCQERKTYLGKFLKEKPQASSAPDCTGEQVSGRKPRLRARLRTKGKLSFLKRKTSQAAFPCQVGRRHLLSKVNPFCKSHVRHRRSSWIATQPVAPKKQKKQKQSGFSSFMFMCVVPAIFKIQGHASLLNLPSAEPHQKLSKDFFFPKQPLDNNLFCAHTKRNENHQIPSFFRFALFYFYFSCSLYLVMHSIFHILSTVAPNLQLHYHCVVCTFGWGFISCGHCSTQPQLQGVVT